MTKVHLLILLASFSAVIASESKVNFLFPEFDYKETIKNVRELSMFSMELWLKTFFICRNYPIRSSSLLAGKRLAA